MKSRRSFLSGAAGAPGANARVGPRTLSRPDLELTGKCPRGIADGGSRLPAAPAVASRRHQRPNRYSIGMLQPGDILAVAGDAPSATWRYGSNRRFTIPSSPRHKTRPIIGSVRFMMSRNLLTALGRTIDTALTAAFLMVSLVVFCPLAAYRRRHLSH